MTLTNYQKKLRDLETGELNPSDFDHMDHVGVAVEALKKYGFFEAVSRFAKGLQALTEKAGVPEKYNATITFASMSLIAEQMHSGDCEDAVAFVQANGPRFTKAFLTGQFPNVRFNSDLAKRIPLLPTDQFSKGAS